MCLILSIQKKVVNITKQAMTLYLVLLLASMMASVNSCEFGKDVIQGLYDRAEVFRKTKVFDTTNREVPLTYQYYRYYNDGTYGINLLELQVNDEYVFESYKNNTANEIETIGGHYGINSKSHLTFNRNENGELHFIDFDRNHNIDFTLPSIDAELPNNFQEDYKQLLLDLKTMRQKMFDFQKGLSKEEFERVQKFDYTLSSKEAFNFKYKENSGVSISVYSAKRDGKETISGRISCKSKTQRFNVVDDNVAVNGEPF